MQDLLRKNNIVLSDYDYQRDIENRSLMAELTVFEVDVLREILDGSLKTSLKQLAKHFDVSEKKLIPVLNKFSKVKLLQRNEDAIVVDKEMRKYYETQIIKFDDDFEPNMEFLQSLLSKVPIHSMPNWYAIHNMTSNIFGSIVETYLLTPKVYQTYLKDLKFKDPALKGIMREVFAAPDFKIDASTVMEEFGLTRAQFEECMLLLEYNLVCCLGYNLVDDQWKEVITPFHEWREYLRKLRDATPPPIEEIDQIVRDHEDDFGFLKDVSHLLEIATETEIKLGRNHLLSSAQIQEFFPHLSLHADVKGYSSRMLIILKELSLIEIKNNQIYPTAKVQKWLLKSFQDQSHKLSGYHIERLSERMRDFREIKNALKLVPKQSWVFLDDFINSMTAAIGDAAPVTFQNKGKRWRYVISQYNETEREFIQNILWNTLFESGIVVTGTCHGRPCFMVTPFGRQSL